MIRQGAICAKCDGYIDFEEKPGCFDPPGTPGKPWCYACRERFAIQHEETK